MITVAVMIFLNPLLLWDAGFQLSVMATLGLIVYADRILGWFQKRMRQWFSERRVKQIAGPVGDYFLFTLAAQLTIFPVLLYHFESFSLSSFLANPLILPPQPFVMIFGGIAVLAGLFIPPLGQVLSWLVWLPLAYTNRMVTWLAEIPGGTFAVGEINGWVVLLLYAVIFGLTLKTKLRDHWMVQWKPLVTAAALAGAALLTWNGVFHLPDGSLRIMVFGLPYQQGILLTTPSGHTLLINPGEHGNTISAQLTQHKPVFDRTIDAVLITSGKQQEYAALPLLLNRFQVSRIVWVNRVPASALAKMMDATAYQKQVQTSVLLEGMEVDCGDGVRLKLISAGEAHTVLDVAYQDFRMFMVQGDVPDSFWEEAQTAVVVVVDQAYQAQNWTPTQNGLLIVPEGTTPLPGMIALNTVNGLEIVTDGYNLSLFKH
jgi:competence protein ComEC